MTAQKKDLSDVNVIAEFASRVANERRLIALYLLTVADIRGTSPKVWNAWKAKLLEDLFWATRRQLCGERMPARIYETAKIPPWSCYEAMESHPRRMSGYGLPRIPLIFSCTSPKKSLGIHGICVTRSSRRYRS